MNARDLLLMIQTSQLCICFIGRDEEIHTECSEEEDEIIHHLLPGIFSRSPTHIRASVRKRKKKKNDENAENRCLHPRTTEDKALRDLNSTLCEFFTELDRTTPQELSRLCPVRFPDFLPPFIFCSLHRKRESIEHQQRTHFTFLHHPK